MLFNSRPGANAHRLAVWLAGRTRVGPRRNLIQDVQGFEEVFPREHHELRIVRRLIQRAIAATLQNLSPEQWFLSV